MSTCAGAAIIQWRIKCQHDLGADEHDGDGDCDSGEENDLFHGDLPFPQRQLATTEEGNPVLCVTAVWSRNLGRDIALSSRTRGKAYRVSTK